MPATQAIAWTFTTPRVPLYGDIRGKSLESLWLLHPVRGAAYRVCCPLSVIIPSGRCEDMIMCRLQNHGFFPSQTQELPRRAEWLSSVRRPPCQLGYLTMSLTWGQQYTQASPHTSGKGYLPLFGGKAEGDAVLFGGSQVLVGS